MYLNDKGDKQIRGRVETERRGGWDREWGWEGQGCGKRGTHTGWKEGENVKEVTGKQTNKHI